MRDFIILVFLCKKYRRRDSSEIMKIYCLKLFASLNENNLKLINISQGGEHVVKYLCPAVDNTVLAEGDESKNKGAQSFTKNQSTTFFSRSSILKYKSNNNQKKRKT